MPWSMVLETTHCSLPVVSPLAKRHISTHANASARHYGCVPGRDAAQPSALRRAGVAVIRRQGPCRRPERASAPQCVWLSRVYVCMYLWHVDGLMDAWLDALLDASMAADSDRQCCHGLEWPPSARPLSFPFSAQGRKASDSKGARVSEPEPRQLVAELGASPSILIRQAQEEEQAPRRAGGLVLRVRVPIASNTPASGLPPAALRPASLAHCALLPPATAYPKSHHSTASTIRPPHPLTIARSFLQALGPTSSTGWLTDTAKYTSRTTALSSRRLSGKRPAAIPAPLASMLSLTLLTYPPSHAIVILLLHTTN
ncbi:hypothetical protein COCSADRAFT_188774 [Bipolaris sorokiniana ND90Pr]|uniref:Uncharacterized protein n=1 Tax=Cochliobolus sativus (strain ND90Pr / ATCC 201652) TaxID=665912 RepID=M2TC93_COCSN|nr:uncharacterized protein COCSADRAFT_188774 [Bipolaris sorokiniana ND90Pr]EMD66442.1 hypothetical protein COCSADRAFT_188774 [Bipolaris sorokiniana ND90Pr]